MSIHHACRSDCDQFDVLRAFSSAPNLVTTPLAIGVAVARRVRIDLAARNRSITVAEMPCDLLGHPSSRYRGGTA